MAVAVAEALFTLAETIEIGAWAVDAAAFLVNNAAIINTVGALAVSNAQAQSAKRKARDAAAASAQDRTVTFRGATLPRREVLGRAITGGDLVWPASTGASKTELVMVLALSAREIDAVEQVFYDGEPITLDVNGYATSGPFATENAAVVSGTATGTVTTSGGTITLPQAAVAGSVQVFSFGAGYNAEFASGGGFTLPFTVSGDGITVTVGASLFSGTASVTYQYLQSSTSLRVIIHRGEAGQVVDPTVTAMFPTDLDASHRLDGVANAVVIAKYDPTAFPQGLRPLTFLVRGSKVFDPRTSTTAWSDNPALLVRHVCQAPLDPAIPAVPVNDTDCIAAANVCDQVVAYTVDGDAATRKRYLAGTIYSEGEAPIKAIDELCQAMAGGRVFTGGKLRMRAGAYTSPVMSLTDADFMGGAVDVVPLLPKEQQVNVANAKAWDPNNRWQFVDVPEVRSAAYITAEGGALPPLTPDLAAVYDMAQAQQLLAIMLREARSAFTLTAQFRLTAYPLEVFDVVSVFNSRYMAAPMNMMVLARQWSLEGGIVLTLRATSAEIYADGTAFEAPLIPPASLLPLPWSVAAPTGMALSSDPGVLGDATQTARMQVTWALHPDASVHNGGAIKIQYRPADEAEPTGDWPSITESGRATSSTIRGVQQNRFYLVRLRAWNGPAASPWSAQKYHQVQAAPLVGTSQLQAGAATDVSVRASGIDDVGTGPGGSGPTDETATVRTGAWANTLGYTVPVQIDASAHGTAAYNGTYADVAVTATLTISTTGGYSETKVLLSGVPDGALTSASAGSAYFTTIDLPAGQTISASIEVHVVHTDRCRYSGVSSLRFSAIKR